MTIARQSVVHPRPEAKAEAEQIFDELLASFRTMPGYLMGFRYRSHEDPAVVGRITLWRRLEDADHAAQQSHIISLRSRLNRIIQGEHLEWALTVEGTPYSLPGS